jgi:hypothetical protein
MTNYTKTTDFAAKDALPSGNAAKIVKGSEIDTEFNNIATSSATKANKNNSALTGTTTFETISDGTIAITAFVDEDNMVSNSATLLPTQQSVKAYVDSQVTAQDLDFQADTGGALSIDLDSETLTFTGGTGVDTSGSGNAVTFAIDSTVATLTGTQTLTNKTLTSPTLNTPTIGTSFTIGSATITEAELEILDGATVTTAELNVLDGITSTTAELNILDGVTSTAAELNILDGVTSTTAELNILDGVTATATELNLLDGVTATTAELNYVDGVTSAIQTQIDTKAPLASPTFTGTVTAAGLTVDTDTLVVDATNNRVGIGTSSPNALLHLSSAGSTVLNVEATGANDSRLRITSGNSNISYIEFADPDDGDTGEIRYEHATNNMQFRTAGNVERMRITSDGNLLVGTTSSINSAKMSVNGNVSTFVIHPAVDNNFDCGHPSYRWDDIRATNATIQTSDRNEKQDIEALSDAEQRVAVASKSLMRKFRWISSVEAKGDDARIHFGIIAQDLEAAFTAEGLDAGRYAMFISDTWTDEDTGEERTRLGVRYSELLAFIISAI